MLNIPANLASVLSTNARMNLLPGCVDLSADVQMLRCTSELQHRPVIGWLLEACLIRLNTYQHCAKQLA
jgi:hypothetical protein